VKLLVVRHGPAGDRADWEGRDDRLRPLTADGKNRVRQAAAGLVTLVPSIDLLATSPLVRAVQTAEIVAARYDAKIVTVDVLGPESDPDDAFRWLRRQQADATIAMVGHEPHLSTLVGHLLTGMRVSLVDLKKGGACLLVWAGAPEPREGTLEWLLTPRVLRRLGE
jgi:phosphohistidine phosphatase